MACMNDIYLVSDNVERLKEAVLVLKDDLEKLNLKVNFNKCRTTRQVPGLEEIAVDKELKSTRSSFECRCRQRTH